jgi:hypothetical protein
VRGALRNALRNAGQWPTNDKSGQGPRALVSRGLMTWKRPVLVSVSRSRVRVCIRLLTAPDFCNAEVLADRDERRMLVVQPHAHLAVGALRRQELTAPTKTSAATTGRPFQPATMPQSGPFDYGRKFELMHYPKISNIVICDRGHHGKESA